MKSIFAHFSMPAMTNHMSLFEFLSGQTNLPWYCQSHIHLNEMIHMLMYPLSFLKVFGFPLGVLLLINAMNLLIKSNSLSLSFTHIILNKITSHFNEIHPNLSTMKTKKMAGKSNTSICNYEMGYALSYLFMGLALMNIGGMMMGTWCITTWFSATMGLAFIMWILTAALSAKNYIVLFCKNTKLYEGEELLFLAGFFPAGTPLWLAPLMVAIEMLSWMMSFLSMGLRMAGNLVAGHVILGILGLAYLELNKMQGLEISLGSFGLIVITTQMAYTALFYLELAVAFIQAYVLTLLASTFLKEMEEIH